MWRAARPSTFDPSITADAPCLSFGQWVLDFLCEKKSIASIKTELVPYLIHKQFSRM
jgi:hypothetical protein